MAGARKLQSEIDKTLKKVTEGLELFDDMRAKLDACDTPSLKTKMEEELKRELKKLQKHRDAIKGWASSSEVKIKTPLQAARRSIEERMEAFKSIERESKMKAYSKEGLMRDAPTTAEERRRMKTTQWMQVLVDKLTDDAEAMEAELEALEEASNAGGGGGKKKGAAEMSPEQLLGRVIGTHRIHVDKMEALIAAVDAGNVDPDEADNLKGAERPAEECTPPPPSLLPP
jgi:CCR4-NOT transcription complex subunit 3